MNNFYEKLFKKTLKNIVHGEQIVRKNIENKPQQKQLLWLGMRRFISHAEAIILLCKQNYNLEALMLLRPLIELVVNLRWILEDASEKNLGKFNQKTKYEFENGIPKMGAEWTTAKLLDKMKKIGFNEQYYKTVIKKIHEELHGNPAVIARSYNKDLTAMPAEAIFSAASQFAGHLLKVTNLLFKEGFFYNNNDIWEQIRIRESKLNTKTKGRFGFLKNDEVVVNRNGLSFE